MRFSRILAIFILLVTGIASFALAAAGCGGSEPTTDDMMQMPAGDGGPTMCTTRGAIALDAVCNTDCDCAMDGMLCTKAPYDRKTMPVCTFLCDPANPNPLCTMGCNMKGYCKLN